MGWNNLQIKKENFFIKKLMEKIDTPEISAYFVHSYNFETKNSEDKFMSTFYGQEITMVAKKILLEFNFIRKKVISLV